MDAERYRRIREVFGEASRRTGELRARYLAQACGDDADLRREVERLLGAQTVPTGSVAPRLEEEPESCGPYRIVGELGRGGMGRVFEAVDTRNDARVALKIVHAHLLGVGGSHERFEREARLGMALAHPNVVRTLEVGHAEGLRYLAMELVEGRTLRAMLADYATLPETLLREIVRQVADGLAAIHGAGIVHRDLKPDNVLVTGDERVRIMDLGVARLMEATVQLTRQGQFLGSLGYAAPEQLDGRPVGPPADLYALGVMLHELGTGSNPFEGSTPGESIRAHLDRVAPPMNERNPEISPFLSEVAATLLAKDPRVRFGSAAELAGVLRDGESSDWWSARAFKRLTIRVPRIPLRRESALHGRGTQLSRLDAVWREACSGAGRVAWIEGEAGIGKSRLIDAFLAALAPDHVHVLYGSFPPSGGSQGITEAILGKFGGGRLEEALSPYLARPKELIGAFAAFVRRELAARPLAGDAVQAVCSDLLRSLADDRPTVWVVDDLHFAPDESVRIALALARAAAGTRAMVLVTARAGLPAATVAPFSRLEHFARLVLPRLDGADVSAILSELCSEPWLAERLAPEIARRSDGVPWFVLELVKGLEEQGLLRRGASGRYEEARPFDAVEMPAGVRDAMAARASRLADDERAVLDVAAVQGLFFDADKVAYVLERPVVAVLRTLAGLERRDGTVRADGRRHRFDHDLLREFVYDELPEPLRAEYHARVAEAFAASAGDPATGPVAREIVAHHLRGTRPEAARPHVDAALHYLEQRHMRADELHLVTLALETPGLLQGRDRGRTLVRRARILDFLFRREEQGAAAKEAIAFAREAGDHELEARATQVLGAWHWGCGRLGEAVEVFERTMCLAREAGNRSLEANAVCAKGTMLWRLGRIAEAEALHRQAVAIAGEIGDRPAKGNAMNHLALVLIDTGRYDEARVLLEEHRQICRESGDRRLEGCAWGNLGVMEWHLGNWEAALEHNRTSHGVAIEIGDRRLEAVSLGNLGLIELELGRLGDALGHFTSQLALGREIGDASSEVHGNSDLGLTHLYLGQTAPARRHLDCALEKAREVGMRLNEAVVLMRLGKLAEDEERFDDARRLLEEAVGALEETGNLDNQAWAVVQLVRVVARAAPDERAATLDRALSLAQQAHDAGALVLGLAMRAEASRTRGDIGKAEAELRAVGTRAGVLPRMEAHWLLWQASGDEEHRARARELFEQVRAASPPGARAVLHKRGALYRSITGTT